MPNPTLGISTCWRSAGAASGDYLFSEIASLDLEAIELEYRITEHLFEELRPLIRRGSFRVLSIHNFFPLPPDFPPERASGDLLNLAGDDPEERRRAVKLTMRTLETAHELEVDRVILHLGYVEGSPILDREWRSRFDQGDEAARNDLKNYLEERKVFAPRALDQVKFSLERLAKRAEGLGLLLGLENRDWPHEIPSLEEMEDLLRTFEGAAAGFWYDVGHAAKQDRFGLAPIQEWMERFGSRLAGVHLHDLKGVRDHLPPGLGELDFGKILQQIKGTEIWILEIEPKFTVAEVREGIQKIFSY
jgi:sugar phosphate isomerase/epimerase